MPSHNDRKTLSGENDAISLLNPAPLVLEGRSQSVLSAQRVQMVVTQCARAVLQAVNHVVGSPVEFQVRSAKETALPLLEPGAICVVAAFRLFQERFVVLLRDELLSVLFEVLRLRPESGRLSPVSEAECLELQSFLLKTLGDPELTARQRCCLAGVMPAQSAEPVRTYLQARTAAEISVLQVHLTYGASVLAADIACQRAMRMRLREYAKLNAPAPPRRRLLALVPLAAGLSGRLRLPSLGAAVRIRKGARFALESNGELAISQVLGRGKLVPLTFLTMQTGNRLRAIVME